MSKVTDNKVPLLSNNMEQKQDIATYQKGLSTANINDDAEQARLLGEKRVMQDYKSNEPLYNPHKNTSWSCCEIVLLIGAWILCIIPIFWFFIPKTVRDYERALIFRLGKLRGGAEGPGVFLINPFTDNIVVVDLRIETKNLQPQAMMTKDSVTVTVDAICFMKVISPVKAILEVDNYRYAFENFSATTLRSVIGTYDLQALLSERDEINEKIRRIIEEETNTWGVAVPAVEIKDVKLPNNMQRAMAAEAEAEREKKAKIQSAKGEKEAATILADAATSIANAPGALQLRYLHTLVKISAEKNSTILFPLPLELMRGVQAFSELQQMAVDKKKDIINNNNGGGNNVNLLD